MMGLKCRDQSWIIFFIFAVTILDPSVSKGAQGKYYFPPSSSQVETVILSHTWAYNDPRNAFEINGKKTRRSSSEAYQRYRKTISKNKYYFEHKHAY